ncbi:MAG: lasso peptide biosynthesis protein [Spirochaetaceae bacterium]|nr:MAG: lasso peptide biosynthesis protein [Spirochaetaceae bacterium]
MKRLLLFFFLLPLLGYAQSKIDEQWYSLLLEGTTVGYLHHTTWQTHEGTVRSEIEQTMQIRRFGVPFSLTQKDVWIERSGAGLVSVHSELDMNGQRQDVEARAADGGLRVLLRRGSEEEELFLPLEGDPMGIYAATLEVNATIARWKETDGSGTLNSRLQYQLFSPESLQVEEIRLSILGRGEVEDSRGKIHRGVLVEEQSSALPGVVSMEVYGEEAQFLYSKTPVGLALEILRLEGDPRATAEGSPAGSLGSERSYDVAAVFDVASLTVVAAGVREIPLERTRAATVLFRGKGAGILHQAVRDAEKDLAVQPEAGQGAGTAPNRVVSFKKDLRGTVTELVVDLEYRPFAPVSSDTRPPRSESIPPEVEDYLAGGFHLDLENPRLTELLKRCGVPAVLPDSAGAHSEDSAGGGIAGADRDPATAIDPTRILCLEQLVDRYIETKSLAYGFAGLEEILEGRAGDCTEHALLLVALLRRAGLPSRMAYGLILTEVGFIGHAWVELFKAGQWHWLDPSFPRGRPYGLKIRLGVMDPGQPVWANFSLALLQVVGTVEAEILEAKEL